MDGTGWRGICNKIGTLCIDISPGGKQIQKRKDEKFNKKLFRSLKILSRKNYCYKYQIIQNMNEAQFGQEDNNIMRPITKIRQVEVGLKFWVNSTNSIMNTDKISSVGFVK